MLPPPSTGKQVQLAAGGCPGGGHLCPPRILEESALKAFGEPRVIPDLWRGLPSEGISRHPLLYKPSRGWAGRVAVFGGIGAWTGSTGPGRPHIWASVGIAPQPVHSLEDHRGHRAHGQGWQASGQGKPALGQLLPTGDLRGHGPQRTRWAGLFWSLTTREPLDSLCTEAG